MTKTTVLNVQNNAAAPAGLDALFAALLQTAAQPPADNAAQPPTDNTNLTSQPIAAPQTGPQASVPNLIELLQSQSPQPSAQPSADSAAAPEPTDNNATQPPVQPAQADTAFETAPATEPATNNPANNDAKSAPAPVQPEQPKLPVDIAQTAQLDTAPPAPDATPATPSNPPQSADAKPAVKKSVRNNDAPDAKNDQKVVPDATNGAAIAVEVNPVIAAMPAVQTQATATQPQTAADSATPVIAAVATTSSQPVRGASQVPSGIPPAKVEQAVADESGSPKTEMSNAAASDSDLPKSDTPKTADAPKSEATAAPQASPQAPQSSASGQSALAVAAVQPQTTLAGHSSVYTNLQVAPQHHADVNATVDTLGVAIAAKSADGIKHFDIRLDPPELGRVEIRLSLDDSGKAQANLVVDKPQTLELLQRDSSALTQSLADAGVSLSNNGLNFSLRGQDRQSDSGSVAKGRSRSLSVKAAVGTDSISNSGSIASLALDSARLDIRV